MKQSYKLLEKQCYEGPKTAEHNGHDPPWPDHITLSIAMALGIIRGCTTVLISHNGMRRSLSAFPMTETELALIANAANIGESNRPKIGYKIPAAMGTPRLL